MSTLEGESPDTVNRENEADAFTLDERIALEAMISNFQTLLKPGIKPEQARQAMTAITNCQRKLDGLWGSAPDQLWEVREHVCGIELLNGKGKMEAKLVNETFIYLTDSEPAACYLEMRLPEAKVRRIK